VPPLNSSNQNNPSYEDVLYARFSVMLIGGFGVVYIFAPLPGKDSTELP